MEKPESTYKANWVRKFLGRNLLEDFFLQYVFIIISLDIILLSHCLLLTDQGVHFINVFSRKTTDFMGKQIKTFYEQKPFSRWSNQVGEIMLTAGQCAWCPALLKTLDWFAWSADRLINPPINKSKRVGKNGSINCWWEFRVAIYTWLNKQYSVDNNFHYNYSRCLTCFLLWPLLQ